MKRLVVAILIAVFLATEVATTNVLAAPPEFSADQIYTIDSFSKEGINSLGHPSKVNFPAGTKVTAKINKRDSAHKGGQSLQISFWLFGTNEISWDSELDPLDMSQAEYLVFWMKASAGIEANSSVILTDKFGKSSAVEIRPYVGKHSSNKNNWKPVIIPLKAFKNINFDRLQRLRLVIHSGILGLFGKASIDDVHFAGPKDLLFESLQDNLIGFPKSISLPDRRKEILKMNDQALLRAVAKDTWKYFENLVDKNTHLPIDHVKLDDARFLGDYTSPTNIGLYLMSCVGAYHLGFISREQAVDRISKTLETLVKLKQYRHFFFNYYNTTHLQPTSAFVSSVDNAWLAAGLIIARSAFKKELFKQVSDILNRMDFDFFYDPGVGQMSLGYDAAKQDLLNFHYSLLCTEARIISMIAIGKHDVPREHWFQIFRTPPAGWKWQTQSPREKDKKLQTYEVRTGFYTYKKRRFVPSWGGSLFEFLMPTLVIPEKRWSPEALGLNNQIVSEIHRDYALKERKYPVWGISPCSVARGKQAIYGEFGVKALGVKGYNDAGILTPHAGFLALDSIPEHAVKNLREYLTRYDIYGEYGFYDSVQARSKVITRQYLALDQGMSFVALANYLNNGSIQQLFATDDIGREVQSLLKDEDFF